MSELAPFGPGAAWLAVRDRSSADVAEALGLADGREVSPAEAVAAQRDTGVLPPVPGVGGRWTLAIGAGVASLSARRLDTLSVLLHTQVQVFVSDPHGAGERWSAVDRGTAVPEVAAADAVAAATLWSLDPTALAGRAPGPALLFDGTDAGPPPPEPIPRNASRRWWWTPPTRR